MGRPKTTDYLRIDKMGDAVFTLTGQTRKPCAVYKWAEVGRPNEHGKIIKLRTTLRSGRKYSTVVWLKKFIKEIS